LLLVFGVLFIIVTHHEEKQGDGEMFRREWEWLKGRQLEKHPILWEVNKTTYRGIIIEAHLFPTEIFCVDVKETEVYVKEEKQWHNVILNENSLLDFEIKINSTLGKVYHDQVTNQIYFKDTQYTKVVVYPTSTKISSPEHGDRSAPP